MLSNSISTRAWSGPSARSSANIGGHGGHVLLHGLNRHRPAPRAECPGLACSDNHRRFLWERWLKVFILESSQPRVSWMILLPFLAPQFGETSYSTAFSTALKLLMFLVSVRVPSVASLRPIRLRQSACCRSTDYSPTHPRNALTDTAHGHRPWPPVQYGYLAR